MKSLSCPNRQSSRLGKADAGAIILHAFYKTTWGKRRRYRCRTCGKTFCSNAGTPYHRLQHRRSIFDEVAALSVEGLNKSAIARVKRIAWNTVHRWLERASNWCRRFSDRKTKRRGEMSRSCSLTRPCWPMWTIRASPWRRSNIGWRKHQASLLCGYVGKT